MAFRFTASEKQLIPDARYGSRLVSKFINCLMWDGKKTVATRVFYHAMDEIERKMGDKINVMEVFEEAIDHVKPAVEIQSKRVGGATYQVPVRVEPKRQIALAMRWIIAAARGKKGRPMHLKLAEELMAAFRREGEAVTKRENVHKMADANKAFAHFAH
jgi:small subunit ribosomal protein S7